MANQPSSRQEIYDRIRETSKDEYVMEEMIRLGFWEEGEEQPQELAEDIRRKGELERELSSRQKNLNRLRDIENLRKTLRKKRLEESRRKQQENKERRLREREERAENWRKRKQTEILFLGPEVSVGLREQTDQGERLKEQNLPLFADAAALATAMEISVGELRFLSFDRKTGPINHYKRFLLPKKTGGERLISAPMPRLKAAQNWILKHILEIPAVSPQAHGFLPERSIVSNALPHTGAAILINQDLKDFFPSISYKRVKGLFRALGYSEQIAIILGLICTEPEVQEVELDGRRYFVALSERRLPQGAPSSPALTNLICRRLDRRLAKISQDQGFAYTRYADDLTFSSKDAKANVARFMGRVRHAVATEGFVIHKDKTRILRKGSRQEVTGLVVNDSPAVARETLRRFRALLFQIKKDGPEGKSWGHSANLLASIRGFASFVYMVQPEKGRKLLEQVEALRSKF